MSRSMTPKLLSSEKNSVKSDEFITKVKPLGFNKSLNTWIDEKKSAPIMSNSAVVSKEQLESDKSKLFELQVDINDKFFSALNSIPYQILAQYIDFDSEVYERLVILNKQVKARIRQTNRKILTFDQLPLKNKPWAQDVQRLLKTSDPICSDSKQVPKDNDLIDDINLTKETDSIESIVDLLLEIKKPLNVNLSNINMYRNNEIDQIEKEIPQLGLRNSTEKKKNTFQIKRPLMMTSIYEAEKSLENGCTNQNVKVDNNIESIIRTLPTSTVTSMMKSENPQHFDNSNIANGLIHDAHEGNEEIIQINSDFFSTSSWWNDSEGSI